MSRKGPKGKITPLFLDELKRVKAEHSSYGRTRAARELRKAGFQASERTVGNALHKLGLQQPPKKRTTKASQ